MAMFDTDRFVAECVDSLSESDSKAALQEVVTRAIRQASSLSARFPVPMGPDDDGILFRSVDLTVTSAVFPRSFSTGIHNHTMPAVIGVWTGCEENHFYERDGNQARPVSSLRIDAGQVLVLGADAIHDVQVPGSSWSGALHVYLGDLIGTARSEWTDDLLTEAPFDGEALLRRWYEASKSEGMFVAL